MPSSECPTCGLPTSPLGPVLRSKSGVLGLPGRKGVTVCGCPDEDEGLRQRTGRLRLAIRRMPRRPDKPDAG